MLLTLAAGSLRKLVSGNGANNLKLADVPKFVMRELELRGLTIPTSMLKGSRLEDLDRLRDSADKAGCPCLVLVEDKSVDFGIKSAAKREAARERVQRLAVAANRLGCNALAFRCDGTANDETFDRIVAEVKVVMPGIERLELNVLVTPGEGLTTDPDKLTDLIKQVGGFRIGTLPTFAHAASCGDAVETLRKLAPYAGAVQATIQGFTKAGGHKEYDLAQCIQAIRSVGFVNTVAIDYVGDGDPVPEIEQARNALQGAIEAEA